MYLVSYIQAFRLCYTFTVTNYITVNILVGFPGGSIVKNPSANAGDVNSIPGSGRSPGE